MSRRFSVPQKRGYTHGFQVGQSVPQPCYDEKYFGGVTRVVLDPAQLQKDLLRAGKKSSAVVSSNFVLAGTAVNCAGGHFAEGWVTCEESSDAGHGYAFMTLPTDSALTAPRRIDSWGRMHREAVALDPKLASST